MNKLFNRKSSNSVKGETIFYIKKIYDIKNNTTFANMNLRMYEDSKMLRSKQLLQLHNIFISSTLMNDGEPLIA